MHGSALEQPTSRRLETQRKAEALSVLGRGTLEAVHQIKANNGGSQTLRPGRDARALAVDDAEARAVPCGRRPAVGTTQGARGATNASNQPGARNLFEKEGCATPM
jgi:hypothetical protein